MANALKNNRNEDAQPGPRRRPGHLARYAQHARISRQIAAKRLKAAGLDYSRSLGDFTEVDRRVREALIDRELRRRLQIVKGQLRPLFERFTQQVAEIVVGIADVTAGLTGDQDEEEMTA